MAFSNRDKGKSPSRFFRFMACLVICTFFLPAPLAGIAAPAQNQDLLLAEVAGWNRHIHERLNSAERRAAIAEAARKEAEMQKASAIARPETKKTQPLAAAPRKARQTEAAANSMAANDRPGSPMRGTGDSERPQSVGAVLFNHAASFMGVPGLTPQRDKYGNYDEGLGFHQDGTVRKAGGTASSGPSNRGQRAQSYMRSGIQGEAGLAGPGAYGAGYASTIWEPGYDPVTGIHWRGDPTRGGRISGFGGSQSHSLDDFDPMNMALDRGLNFGNSFINSMGEAAISGLVDGGRARLNFYFDKDGYFSGEGDALLPFYDSKYSTFYTQLGARSMHDSSDTRWIGNFGLGQRWFPFAEGEDIKSADYNAGNWMIGYNAFFDYDLTRDHQRGGFGIETQYDWLRLASNYYFPLSSWKGSEDFDPRFVKERPAEGWDVRAKGYLPFYRNIAITGAYSQWYGDHVGMFGPDELEKDPRVWSYGIEYTPVPMLSGFITQKSTERGKTDTEFGLNFTYHFGMPWDDQTSHAKVAELRTVGGGRHDFVDRENRIILEYKAKSNLNIEYLGSLGGNRFLFRVINGFGEFAAGQTVQVSTGGAWLAELAPVQPQTLFAQAMDFLDELISVKAAWAGSLAKSYTTDGQGQFVVQLDPAGLPPSVTVTATVGNSSASFTLIGSSGGGSGGIVFQATNGGLAFNSASGTTATFTVLVRDSSGVNVPDGTTVTWNVASTGLSKNLAVESTRKGTFEGLTLGSAAVAGTGTTVTSTTSGGLASITLKDILGERDVTVTASVSTPIVATATSGTFTFGKGPLSKFKLGYPDAPGNTVRWSVAIAACGSTPPTLGAGINYYPDTKLPGVINESATANLYDIGSASYKPMRDAAGLPSGPSFWSGRSQGTPNVDAVDLSNNSYDSIAPESSLRRVLCVRTSP